MSWVAVLLALGAGEPETPSDQSLVFYTARLALREAQPTEALKLWLLRNALVSGGQGLSPHDEEFRSVAWAALGAAGLCEDGFPRDDEGGAGLWPLALHNTVVSAMVKGRPQAPPSPFDAFEVGRQQRLISLLDVLSGAELASVSFHRTTCLLPDVVGLTLGNLPGLELDDRYAVGLFLKAVLRQSLSTLDRSKVEGVAAIEARIFDLDLALMELQSRAAKKAASEAERKAAKAGVSKAGVREVRAKEESFRPTEAQARLLQSSLSWPAAQWLSLSPQRRLALFARARSFVGRPSEHEAVILSNIDALLDRRAGEEIASWVGFLGVKESPDRRALVTAGERGKRLLELEPSTGFKERATIALHRGVSFLEAGRTQDALRSFAAATAFAEESREPAAVLALAMRWLSYVLGSYETSGDVVATLRALVPAQEYNAVIEDLVWRAALRVDERSFERLVASRHRGGAFDRRVDRLRLLARGRAGELATQLRDAAKDEPNLTLVFTRQLIDHIEAEDAGARRANVPLLKLLEQILTGLEAQDDGRSASARLAGELLERVQAVLEGLADLDSSAEARARALAPGHETFAGNVRLAPVDPLPWPFVAPEPAAPSAFVPLELRPVEWRDEHGELVFGWRISE